MGAPVQELFTFQSFGTIAGASAAVIAVSNTFRVLFRTDSPIPAFLASGIVAFLGAYIAEAFSNPAEWALIFLNACLLFCSALGMQETIVNVSERKQVGTIKAHGKPQEKRVKWLSSWFRR